MKDWDVPAKDRPGEGFLALREMWPGSGEQGQSTGDVRSGGIWGEAPSGGATSPLALVAAGTLNGRDHGSRLGEALGDPSAEGNPPCSPADRESRVTVVVCDQLPVFARGLAKLLEEEAPNLWVTGIEFSLSAAKRTIAELHPAVALIGLSMDGARELDTVREICSAFPGTRVVVLLPEAEAITACDTLAGAGVAGYELKERDASEIAEVVSLVARGHIVAPAAVGLPREKRPDPHSLDDVEWEILKGVARSETNRELAARLYLSERTICRRLEGIYSKLHLADRLQAAVYAAIHGLVTHGTWRPTSEK